MTNLELEQNPVRKLIHNNRTGPMQHHQGLQVLTRRIELLQDLIDKTEIDYLERHYNETS